MHVAEKALNYVSDTLSGIAAAYQRHAYEKKILEPVTLWGAYLDALMRELADAEEGVVAENFARDAAEPPLALLSYLTILRFG